MTLLAAYLIGTYTLFTLTSPCTGVIGVAYNKNSVAKHVFYDSPAWEAGIKAEDRILRTDELKGKVGTKHKVKWIRDGVLYEKEIKRVCVSDLKTHYEEW